ncbi:MAG: radical SAM protein [Syntrophobacterales bacterium]|nr:radical SAM protein [Syntrophobacterales bacterium]
MKEQFHRRDAIKRHPCFSEDAHGKYGRIHLPVAPICNISCNYCDRRFDCVNESRPGVSSRILTPKEALERTLIAVERQNISVVGVAGPGDPLANETTYEFFSLVRKNLPKINLCLSTNGLYLPEKLKILEELGVWTVTITVNAISVSVAEKIYSWIIYDGRLIKGKEAVEVLLRNQWKGIEELKKRGFYIKINSVLISGVNEIELELIAQRAKRLRVEAMNIIPLIPNGRMRYLKKPSYEQIDEIRQGCGKYIPQIRHCRQCRADAFGSLEEDRDIELELINSALAIDYCEIV